MAILAGSLGCLGRVRPGGPRSGVQFTYWNRPQKIRRIRNIRPDSLFCGFRDYWGHITELRDSDQTTWPACSRPG